MADNRKTSTQEMTISCKSCGVQVTQKLDFILTKEGGYVIKAECPKCGNIITHYAHEIKKPKQKSKALPAQKSKEENKAISFEIDTRNQIARLDMATGLAGIARPLKNGATRHALEIHQPFDEWTMTFRGSALTDRDLGVLLAIISIAQKQHKEFGKQLNFKPKIGSEIEGLFQENIEGVACKIKPKEAVEGNNIANDRSVITVETSFQKIRGELGRKSSSSLNSNLILASLHWLSSITVLMKKNESKLWGISKLIHAGAGNDQTLSITLSCRLAEVILGSAVGHGATDLKIYRNLDNSVSKILYAFLAAYLASHNQKKILLNNLVKHVWGEDITKLSKENLKDRRKKIRSAISDIEEVSSKQWTFTERKDEVVEINRKELSGDKQKEMREKLSCDPQEQQPEITLQPQAVLSATADV